MAKINCLRKKSWFTVTEKQGSVITVFCFRMGLLYDCVSESNNFDINLIRKEVQFACAKKNTHVNILQCVNILRSANQPVSKFKLCSHGFYHQEYFCM